MVTLSRVLHSLHSRALAASPNPVSTDLSGGLRITLQLANGQTYISVARRDAHPRTTELDTVFRYYPNAKPRRYKPRIIPNMQPDGFYHITANWENSNALDLDTIPTQLSMPL